MALSTTNYRDETDQVKLDLFKSTGANPKEIFNALNETEKAKLLDRINRHIVFYGKIAEEEHKKPSFRVEIAKFRVKTLYPQLLKFING